MKKSAKVFKRISVYVFLVISIFIFCLLGTMYWLEEDVSLNIFAKEKPLSLVDNDQEKYALVNLELLNGNTYKTVTDDGYLIVELEETMLIKDILINISLGDSNDLYDCQVFFCGVDGEFNSKDSVSTKLYSGENVVTIPEGNYKKVRFDFTNKKDKEFIVNSISLYEEYISDTVKYLALFISIILVLFVSIYYFDLYKKVKILKNIADRWNGIEERKRCILILMFMSIVTFSTVFLNVFYNGRIYAYSDIGSDTIMQYIPQYTLIIDKIRNGSISMWLSEVGYGYNLAYFFMVDPLLLLTFGLAVIFGTQHLSILIVLYKLVGILLCGYVAFKFLSFFSDNYKVVAIVSYLYAFNGFTIVWGQHYLFFDYPLYAIIVFYYAERYLRKNKQKFDIPLIIISFASMAYSVYMSYIIYLPLIFYVIIRYLNVNKSFEFKKFVLTMLNMGINIILGFVAGLSIALVYIKNLTGSGRIDSETSSIAKFLEYLKISYFEDDFFGSLQRFFSANLSGVGIKHTGLFNYYEEPQLFFTAIFIVVLFQYIFTIRKASTNIKQIVCKIASIILVTLALYNKGVLFALYAFSQESRRTTFVIFPVLAIMFVVVLDDIFRKRILSKVGLVLGVLFSFYLILYNFNDHINIEKKILVLSSMLVLVVSATMFLIVYYKQRISKLWIYMLVFGILMFINVTTELYISTNRKGQVAKEWLKGTELSDDTREAIEYLNKIDNTYYRVDKNYELWNRATDSYFINYKPVTFYNSIMSNATRGYITQYMNPAYLTISKNIPSFASSPNDVVQYSSLGVKYVLSDYEIPDYQYYRLIERIGEIYIYENIVNKSYTTFHDEVVLESEFNELDYISRSKIQQKALVIKDTDKEKFEKKVKSVKQLLEDFVESDITEEISINGEAVSSIFNEDIHEDKEFVFSEGWDSDLKGTAFLEISTFVISDTIGKNIINIYFDCGEGYNYQNVNPILCNNKECQVRYPIPREAKKMLVTFSVEPSRITEFKIKDSKEELKLIDNPSTFKEGKNSSYISGKVNCDREGLLYIPLTYDDNWKITLNGKEVQKYRVNSGFIAIKVLEGENEISIAYECKELKYGVVCLILSMILISIYYIICKKTDKRIKS